MSNIFLQNEQKNSVSLDSSESISMPKFINFNKENNQLKSGSRSNKNYSETSFNFLSNNNENNSATSILNNSFGGSINSKNESEINTKDINNLISMLTTESDANTTLTNLLENKLRSNELIGGNDDENNDFIDTDILERKLYKILNKSKQTGGFFTPFAIGAAAGVAGKMLYENSKKKNDNNNDLLVEIVKNHEKNTLIFKQKLNNITPSSKLNVLINENDTNISNLLNIKTPYSDIEQKTINNLKLNLIEMENTLEANKQAGTFIESKNNNYEDLNTTTNVLSPTSSFNPNNSITSSDLSNRLPNLTGGANPHLKAFGKLRKYVAEKLKIANGPVAMKIGGQLQRDIKAKHPDIKLEDIFEEAKKELNKTDKYKKMIPIKN